MKHTCPICNTVFDIRPARLKRSKNVFCSQKCYAIFKTGKPRTLETRLKIKKATTGKNNPFYGKKHLPHSRKKMGARGSEHPKWRGGVEARKTTKICAICNNEFARLDKSSKYCSHKCYSKSLVGGKLTKERKRKIGEAHKGSKNINWKGGRFFDKSGYVYILSPNHPRSKVNALNYVYEHILVVEAVLGRHLKRTEICHHIDGNKQNNHPSNLYLFKSNSDHMSYHSNFRCGNCQKITKSNII